MDGCRRIQEMRGVTDSGGDAAAAAAAGTCWLSRSSVTKHVLAGWLAGRLAGWLAGRHSALLGSVRLGLALSRERNTATQTKPDGGGGRSFRCPPLDYFCVICGYCRYISQPDVPNGGAGGYVASYRLLLSI